MLETFTVDLRMYRDYSEDFDRIEFTGNLSPALLKDMAVGAINRSATSKLEALVVLIGFKKQARNKLKAVQKCEEEYASTKQLAAEKVHPVIWKKMVEIKSASA